MSKITKTELFLLWNKLHVDLSYDDFEKAAEKIFDVEEDIFSSPANLILPR